MSDLRSRQHRIAVGAETMALRVERTCSNALALARALAAHPKVARVYYPGLPEHPEHARATELFRHYGGLLSFELVDGADCVDMPIRRARNAPRRHAHAGDSGCADHLLGNGPRASRVDGHCRFADARLGRH
jgi:O-acetylhomoserine (thiol)-lyase